MVFVLVVLGLVQAVIGIAALVIDPRQRIWPLIIISSVTALALFTAAFMLTWR